MFVLHSNSASESASVSHATKSREKYIHYVHIYLSLNERFGERANELSSQAIYIQEAYA